MSAVEIQLQTPIVMLSIVSDFHLGGFLLSTNHTKRPRSTNVHDIFLIYLYYWQKNHCLFFVNALKVKFF